MAYSKLQLKDLAYGTLIEDTSSSIKIAGDLHYSLPTDATSNGNFYITVDDEVLLVTDVATDVSGHYDYDVVRAQEGTSYVTHISGNKVYLNVIAKNINNIQDYISLIDTTSNIDLNSMEAAVALNTAKVTNATHSGEMTGATTLTADPTLISNKTGVTPVAGDYVLLWDNTDSLLKKADVTSFLGAGGGGDVTGPASALLNSIAIFDSSTGKHIDDSLITIDTSSNIINTVGGLKVETAAKYITSNTLTSGTSVSWDLTAKPISKITLAHNVGTFTLSNIQLNINNLLIVTQDASTAYTITFPGNVTWAGGYAPTFPLSSVTYISLYSPDGTGLFGQYTNNVNTIAGNVYSDATSFGVGKIAICDSTSDNYIDFSPVTIDTLGNISSVVNINGVSFSTLVGDVATNSAKVTNQTHSGDVTGATGLTIVPAAISGKTSATLDSGDYILMLDASDSTLKKALIDTVINTVTPTNTVSLTNKRNIPRVSTLTSAATVNWDSSSSDIYRISQAHNILLAADTGTPNDGEVREFLIKQTGSYTLTLDTTSASKAFIFGSDTTSVASDVSGKTTAILTQYDSSSSKWMVLSQIKGYTV
jgi:hypothetical protein